MNEPSGVLVVLQISAKRNAQFSCEDNDERTKEKLL
jgi:hypothetical protein